MPDNKHLRRGLVLLYSALGIFSLWLFISYALKWLLPFIIAFAISRLIEPLVRFLSERFKFRRWFASAVCTLIAFALLLSIVTILIVRIIYEIAALAKDLPSLLSELTRLISALKDKINIYIISAPAEMQSFFQSALDAFEVKSTDMFAALSGKLLAFLSSAAAFSPKLILFLFTCAISTFFISSGYKEVTAFIMRQLPRKHHTALRDFKSDLQSVIGRWVKAELMLSGVTFIQMLIAFFLMRIDFAILLAVLVAFIDLLPILGLGSVLVPWSIAALACGDFSRAAAIAVTFGIAVVVRNILEPKLIGSQIGLPPIAALLSMYVGLCAAGIFGMVLFPICIIMLKNFNDRGYVKLWK